MDEKVTNVVSTEDIEANNLDDVIADLLGKDPVDLDRWEATTLARQVAAAAVRYRMRYGLTQVSLGARLGLKQPAIARLESGETNPKFETLQRLARELGMSFTIEIASDHFNICVTDPPDGCKKVRVPDPNRDAPNPKLQLISASDEKSNTAIIRGEALATSESPDHHEAKSLSPAKSGFAQVR